MIERLRNFANDPMWSDHAEVPKTLLVETIELHDALVKALEDLVATPALAGVRQLVAGWNGEGKPDGPYQRHPPKLGAKIPTNCGAIYDLDEAIQRARAALIIANNKDSAA